MVFKTNTGNYITCTFLCVKVIKQKSLESVERDTFETDLNVVLTKGNSSIWEITKILKY